MKLGAKEGVDTGVVEAGEEVLLGDAEDASDHGLVEVAVALQRGAQEVAHEVDDRLSKAVEIARVDGLVVLVDEDDHLLPVMGVEMGAHVEEGALVEPPVSGAVQDLPEALRLDFVEPAALEEVAMLDEDIDDLLPDHGPARLEGGGFAALEVEVDHRIALEVRPGLGACLPDREILKQVGEVLVPFLEPAAEHGEVQRLAEAPWPRQEHDLDPGAVEELLDQAGLVDVFEAAFAEFPKIVDADGDTERHGGANTLATGRGDRKRAHPRRLVSRLHLLKASALCRASLAAREPPSARPRRDPPTGRRQSRRAAALAACPAPFLANPPLARARE